MTGTTKSDKNFWLIFGLAIGIVFGWCAGLAVGSSHNQETVSASR